MAIYDLLPKFGYIEPNNLKGLQSGFVVAQMPVADSAKETITVEGKGKYMENGTICDISADGIVAPSMKSKNLFICYSEPLNTVIDAAELYAVNLNEEHARLVQLVPGDEWMATKALDLAPKGSGSDETNPLFGRIVEITTSTGMGKSDDWFSCTTMANGDAARHYMFIG